jgi:hypothetical protein
LEGRKGFVNDGRNFSFFGGRMGGGAKVKKQGLGLEANKMHNYLQNKSSIHDSEDGLYNVRTCTFGNVS